MKFSTTPIAHGKANRNENTTVDLHTARTISATDGTVAIDHDDTISIIHDTYGNKQNRNFRKYHSETQL